MLLDQTPEQRHEGRVLIATVPTEVGESRVEPPLDGPEPRLARLGDGGPDAGRTPHGFPALSGATPPRCTLADTTIAPLDLNAI